MDSKKKKGDTHMKTIVIGDIHGCYNELKSLLDKLEKSKKYNKKTDRLIFLGDYIDRGSDSRLVIELIRKLQKTNKNVIALMGNHEDMLLDYLDGNDNSWLYNGAEKTADSYNGHDAEFKSDIKWIRTLPLYYKDKNFIYVHAGLDLTKPLNKQAKETLLWIREDFIYSTIKYNKRVVYGHTPSFFVSGSARPYTFNNNIGIDTGCVYDGALTALIIDGKKIKEFVQVKKGQN